MFLQIYIQEQLYIQKVYINPEKKIFLNIYIQEQADSMCAVLKLMHFCLNATKTVLVLKINWVVECFQNHVMKKGPFITHMQRAETLIRKLIQEVALCY